MPSPAKCSIPLQTARVAAMLSLSACAMVNSDSLVLCPPVVPYSRAEQAQVAGELTALPGGVLIADWLADYAVMRDQARACVRVSTRPSFTTENGHIFAHFLS